MGMAQSTQTSELVSPSAQISIPSWTASNVKHAYGLPELKPKVKGSLTVDDHGIAFIAKSGRYDVPWTAIAAISNGNERVELWGTTGRIVRMVIPNGGGLAAATVMHHKVNELTVEFHDTRGAYHGAVFFLPAADAVHVMESSSRAVPSLKDPIAIAASVPTTSISCQGASGLAGSVLVSHPTWNDADVPAAYRAAVYEHIIDRLQKVQGVTHVYRAGKPNAQPVCPQFTISISVVSFKPGNQVARASMGPIGFFAKTTQLVFSATITDVSGRLNKTEPLKAIVRGESESLTIADSIAKKLAKLYANDLKQLNRGVSASGTPPPHTI
jgi:hypothetical protein